MKKFVKENKTALIKILISVLLVIMAVVAELYNAQLSFVLYIISYITVAYKIIFAAFKQLFKLGKVGEKALMVIASIGAIVTESFFEATLVIVLYLIGEMIEDSAQDSSRKSIDTLMAIRPDKARVNGEEISVDAVKIGDIVEVFAGERIPLDGVVVDGIGSVDSSILTGESEAIEVRQGTKVFSGTLNLEGVIRIEVTALVHQSAAQRIIDLSQNSLSKKARAEKFIEKFAKYYTPSVILVAILVAVIPSLFGLDFMSWAYKSFAILAISCPCAIVLSVPLAYFCAIGNSAKRGILVKNSEALEKLTTLNAFAFDKTGTLTKSDLHVTKVEAFGDYTKIQLLAFVAIAEAKSNHPIASAVRKEAERFKIVIKEGENYNEKIGMGVECDCEYGHIKAGNRMYVGGVAAASNGTVYVSLNGKYIGYVGVGDDLKPNSKKAFDKLRSIGIKKLYIVSGDKKSKVDAVASTLYADGAYAQLLPERKLDAIEDIMSSVPDVRLAYCGDGINDLPCLSRADVGFSMGAVSSDATIEKSDVIIMDDNLEKIPLSISIANHTRKIVIGNIVFALSAKLVILLLSIIVNFSMLGAIVADVGIMLIAVLNSLRAGKK